MKLVVDTNIVFSALLNTSSKIGDLLMNSNGLLSFYSCETLIVEIENHYGKLTHLSKMTTAELDVSFAQISKNINWIPESNIPFAIWKESAVLVRDVDAQDVAFIALSKHIDAKLWTGDKKLVKGLLAKGFSNFILSDEVDQLRELLK